MTNDFGFRKYQHLERLGTDSVENILDGMCHIFYKIDGTNASVWWHEGEIKFGSRNRVLSLENDNAGFMAWGTQQESLKKFQALFDESPGLVLYGEWLVPHSLKTYRDDAWRNFYVFDVFDRINDSYMVYEDYQELLTCYDLNYIPPLAVIKQPTVDNIFNFLEKSNQFLVKDGAGSGEGIVIKNYDYYNKYGQQVWAKVITNEFKEVHHKVMGAPLVNGTKMVEEAIVEKYCTSSFIQKELAKIINETGEWNSKLIPRLLNTVFHELVKEEIWNILKEHKQPTINFRTLNSFVIRAIKRELGI